MAEFKVTVEKILVEEHPNADALELAVIGGYRAIVQKGKFKSGDLVVYIPEQSVLPEWLIRELNLEGKLAGKKANRVKAIKLRGVLSQGLVYPVHTIQAPWEFKGEYQGVLDVNFIKTETTFEHYVQLGDDVAEALGIVKYEPEIPVSMQGQVFNAHGMTLKYDIENIKRYPDILVDGEICVITEKLHGTWCCFGFHPDAPHAIVTSKGHSSNGLAFKFVEENDKNIYVRTFRKYQEALEKAKAAFPGFAVYILGEIFGKGVQDLDYGQTEPQFRVFDVYVGKPGEGGYLSPIAMLDWVKEVLELETVPLLHVGPFDMAIVEELTNGKETVSGKDSNIREGVVIKPALSRTDNRIGRVVLKSVSEAYLMRKGGTELQ